MHRYLHLGIATQKQDVLGQIIAITPIISSDWVFYSSTNFILWSDKDLQYVIGAVRARLAPDDFFLLAEIDFSRPSGGFLPPNLWEWINRDRTKYGLITPPPSKGLLR